MIIRSRSAGDLDRCAAVAEAVYAVDGYPAYLPGQVRPGVLRSFLDVADAHAAWVAEEDGDIVGHVALHAHGSGPVMDLAGRATGRPAEALAVVARLLVAPQLRRSGAGRALLEVASEEATARRLWPVLDVAVFLRGAVGLYESAGWRCAGEVSVPLPDGRVLEELVYVGPPPPDAAPPLSGSH